MNSEELGGDVLPKFDVERQVGTYGIKSKVKLGFTPGVVAIAGTLVPHEQITGRSFEFFLKIELRGRSDIFKWHKILVKSHPKAYYTKGKNLILRDFINTTPNKKAIDLYYFKRTPRELGEIIEDCPILVAHCGRPRIDSAIRELELRAFWERVVDKDI